MNPNESRFTILFLCTGNSARSIFAEYLLKKIAPPRFPDLPRRIETKAGIRIRWGCKFCARISRSTHLTPTANRGTRFEDVPIDFVITLCDNARETCPVRPGSRIKTILFRPVSSSVLWLDRVDFLSVMAGSSAVYRRLILLAGLYWRCMVFAIDAEHSCSYPRNIDLYLLR